MSTPHVHPRRALSLLLVDDTALIRQAVRDLLEPLPTVRLAGEAVDGEAGVKMALALRPDIVIMDVQMPKLNGIDATRRITEALPQTSVIGFSVQTDGRLIGQCLRQVRSPFSRKSERLTCRRSSRPSSEGTKPDERGRTICRDGMTSTDLTGLSCVAATPFFKIQHEAFSKPPICRWTVIVSITLLRYSEALAYVLLAFAVRWIAYHYLAIGLPFLLLFLSRSP